MSGCSPVLSSSSASHIANGMPPKTAIKIPTQYQSTHLPIRLFSISTATTRIKKPTKPIAANAISSAGIRSQRIPMPSYTKAISLSFQIVNPKVFISRHPEGENAPVAGLQLRDAGEARRVLARGCWLGSYRVYPSVEFSCRAPREVSRRPGPTYRTVPPRRSFRLGNCGWCPPLPFGFGRSSGAHAPMFGLAQGAYPVAPHCQRTGAQPGLDKAKGPRRHRIHRAPGAHSCPAVGHARFSAEQDKIFFAPTSYGAHNFMIVTAKLASSLT